MKFFKLILQINFLYLNDFDEFLKFFEILYYRIIGFSDMKFFKLILQTIILNMNDFTEIFKIF